MCRAYLHHCFHAVVPDLINNRSKRRLADPIDSVPIIIPGGKSHTGGLYLAPIQFIHPTKQ